MNSNRWLHLGVLLILCAAGGFSQEKRAFEASDLVAGRSLSGLQLSPDGEWLAFVVSEPDEVRNRASADIWLMRSDGSGLRRLTAGAESETHPRWSPDGAALAFLSERSEGRQVFLLPLSGGEVRQATRLESGVQSFEWRPDGKGLALLAALPPDKESEKRRKEQRDAYVLGEELPKHQVWFQDLSASEASPAGVLTDGRLHFSHLSWSSASDRLALLAAPGSEADASHELEGRLLDEQYALAQQLRNASRSIVANYVEGYVRQRRNPADHHRFLTYSQGSCDETKYWLELAKDLGYLDEKAFSEHIGSYEELGRMLHSILTQPI